MAAVLSETEDSNAVLTFQSEPTVFLTSFSLQICVPEEVWEGVWAVVCSCSGRSR